MKFFRFILPVISIFAFGLLALYPTMTRALVCQYNRSGETVCETLDKSFDAAEAEKRCTTICQMHNKDCTAGSIVDKCPVGLTVIPTTNLVPPFAFANSPSQLIGRILGQVVGILGALTFLVFAYGGFMWLTSAGNEDKISQGSQAMMWAIIGLFVVFSSYMVLNEVLRAVST